MPEAIEVGPLEIQPDQSEVTFRFADPMAMTLEIPPSFEEQLRDTVEANKDYFEGKHIRLDLSNVPAISSRQLGMILTIREAIKRFGSLTLLHTSGSVRHLLKLTGTDRFFDIT